MRTRRPTPTPAPAEAPAKPQNAAEWLTSLLQQKAQKEAELNQILGAIALAKEWEGSVK